ncbi:hypothetical protein HYH03_013680 [Edaphochlamys debaryana]|uniref:HhH-GPD domain-containing protein n=1 Tax=Edaphochlamys debaryana TaxID=47281 RepID=A0A835XQA7_9CHLO|nr:hypothetical protein HYH03_013680 [Edaphochlamys debaryana]|eukprot:KAG2487680.1 hypothetical protein HYH03_013680 [Edaphochlamys debaryana]
MAPKAKRKRGTAEGDAATVLEESPDSPSSPVAGNASAPAAPPPTSSTAKKRPPRPLPASPSFKLSSLDKLKAKALTIQRQLDSLYPDPPIPLHHGSTFQLLVAVMLSAQSTDAKVNTVTPALFARGRDAEAMAGLEASEIESMIRVLGLAPTKAKNVRLMSQMLMELHGGQVPSTFEALEALPGVGHKTASVVMSQAFGHPAFPVDTHIHRLAQRWGLSNGKSVEQTEQDLKTLFPQDKWRDCHLQIIYFGREHCPAKSHDPAACPVCSWAAPGARGAPPDLPDPAPAEADDTGGTAVPGSALAAAAAMEAVANGASEPGPAAAEAPGRARDGPQRAQAGEDGEARAGAPAGAEGGVEVPAQDRGTGTAAQAAEPQPPAAKRRRGAAGGQSGMAGGAVVAGDAGGAAGAGPGQVPGPGPGPGPFDAFRAGAAGKGKGTGTGKGAAGGTGSGPGEGGSPGLRRSARTGAKRTSS